MNEQILLILASILRILIQDGCKFYSSASTPIAAIKGITNLQWRRASWMAWNRQDSVRVPTWSW